MIVVRMLSTNSDGISLVLEIDSGAMNSSVHMMIWMPYWLVTSPLT